MLGNHSTTELYPQPRNSVACKCPLLSITKEQSYCLWYVMSFCPWSLSFIMFSQTHPPSHLLLPPPPMLKIKPRVQHILGEVHYTALCPLLFQVHFNHDQLYPFFFLILSSQHKASKMACSQESPIPNRFSLHSLLCVGGRPICFISAFPVCQFSLKIEIRAKWLRVSVLILFLALYSPQFRKKCSFQISRAVWNGQALCRIEVLCLLLNRCVVNIIVQQDRVSVSRNLPSYGEEDE